MEWQAEAFQRSLTNLAPSTTRSYMTDVYGFVFWVERGGLTAPEQVDRIVLRRWLGYLAALQLAPATIARKASAIRRYFDWLHKRGKISANPARRMQSPSPKSRLPEVLRPEQLEALLTPAAEDDERPPSPRELQDAAVIEVLYGSGLRANELCELDIADIDFGRARLLVHGKGGRDRLAPLSEPAIAALDGWLAAGRHQLVTELTPPGAVFLNQKGKRLTPRDARRIVLRRSNDTAGPLQLRHTFATHLLDGGADLSVVKELLGHERMASTERYTHVSKDRLRAVLNRTHPRA